VASDRGERFNGEEFVTNRSEGEDWYDEEEDGDLLEDDNEETELGSDAAEDLGARNSMEGPIEKEESEPEAAPEKEEPAMEKMPKMKMILVEEASFGKDEFEKALQNQNQEKQLASMEQLADEMAVGEGEGAILARKLMENEDYEEVPAAVAVSPLMMFHEPQPSDTITMYAKDLNKMAAAPAEEEHHHGCHHKQMSQWDLHDEKRRHRTHLKCQKKCLWKVIGLVMKMAVKRVVM